MKAAEKLKERVLKQVLKKDRFYFKQFDVTWLPGPAFKALMFYLYNLLSLTQTNILLSLGRRVRYLQLLKLKGMIINMISRSIGGLVLTDPHTMSAILLKIANMSMILDDEDFDIIYPDQIKYIKAQAYTGPRDQMFVTEMPQDLIKELLELEHQKKYIDDAIYEWARWYPEAFAAIPFSARLLDAVLSNTDGTIYLGSLADLNFIENMRMALAIDLSAITNISYTLPDENQEKTKKSEKSVIVLITKYDCPHCKDVEMILRLFQKLRSHYKLVIYDTIDLENVFYSNAIYVRFIPAVLHRLYILQGIKKPENPFIWKIFFKQDKQTLRELRRDWEHVLMKVQSTFFTHLLRGLPITSPNLEDDTVKTYIDKVFPPIHRKVVRIIEYNIENDLEATPQELLEATKTNIVIKLEEARVRKPKIVKIKRK